MVSRELPLWTDEQIVAARPARNPVSPRRPYLFFNEQEFSAAGKVETVSTIFLTNRECPFRCLMCDLWKNTTEVTVPDGAIPEQIEFALRQLPPATQIKLYNSGNFFDPAAIPLRDYDRILELAAPYSRLVVENHPRLCGSRCLAFARQFSGQLEVAMGLETIHPEILPRLNKQMTLDDFRTACNRLTADNIALRSFVLLKPPYMAATEAVSWAMKSILFAFDCGVECVAVVPTRGGNGAMEQLQDEDHFSPPRLADLEQVLEQGLAYGRGRVFVDLWDIEKLFDCRLCGPARRNRLDRMNLSQSVEPAIPCECRE